MNLSDLQFVFLVSGILLIITAVTLFYKNRVKASLIFLLMGAFGLGCFMALLDPFLNTWDELYHAMVAKNLMDNPLFPILYKTTVLKYDYTIWTDNYIWLHKQPLFLWQMALSMKIFGVNEFAVRLPGIVMHAIIPIFIYRIGAISLNRETGFLAALFFSLAYYPLELLSGKYTADHNDLAFLFYVTAGFWAWFEYNRSKNGYWLIAIGFFAGCAVLVKWLMGLLVFICWSFTLLIDRKSFFKIKRYYPLIISFIIALTVFIPWQVYILNSFPVESRFEFSAFSKHFFSVVESHAGGGWFHFNAIDILYGKGLLIPIVLSLFILARKMVNLSYTVFILGAIVFVYLFFSMAASKMLSFCLIVSPFIFLGLSALLLFIKDVVDKYTTYIPLRMILTISLITVFSYKLMNIEKIYENHEIGFQTEKGNRRNKITERMVIDNLPKYLSDKNYVVFNAKYAQGGNITFMFYSDYIAYRFIPTESQCKEVIAKGYKIAILDFGEIPDYILSNPEIIRIPVSIYKLV
jgi:4-amino-4-deoxy-L-arabinose transferase